MNKSEKSKFTSDKHHSSKKHVAPENRTALILPCFLTYTIEDLTDKIVKAYQSIDIPLYKLRNKAIKQLLESYLLDIS